MGQFSPTSNQQLVGKISADLGRGSNNNSFSPGYEHSGQYSSLKNQKKRVNTLNDKVNYLLILSLNE